MPPVAAYIAVVQPPGQAKLDALAERGITFDEVKEAVVLCRLIRSAWHNDPDRGWRLLVTGATYTNRILNIVLYPVDIEDGLWRLGTAMVSS